MWYTIANWIMEPNEFSENDITGEGDRSTEPSLGDPSPDPAPLPYVPDSLAETTRKSGLAWSAGIVFFSSIAFMLVLGWFADLLLGSSPWGIVVGILLGSLIGFMQFFRISSQIFAQPTAETPPRTLIPDQTEETKDRFSA
jgi:F0F1-type ATP synthase assembly protein I